MITFKRFKFSHGVMIVIMLFLVNWTVDAGAYEVKSNKQNSVRIDVRPVQLLSGKPAKFEIRMNTHSVDLSYDMVAVSTLKDNQGREYRPINWEGSSDDSHHRQGILEFPKLETNTASITLVIRKIAEVPERIFEWSVKR